MRRQKFPRRAPFDLIIVWHHMVVRDLKIAPETPRARKGLRQDRTGPHEAPVISQEAPKIIPISTSMRSD
eukprot:5893310-Pyramimonas_sp.AAC.1